MIPWPLPAAHANLRATQAVFKGLVFAATVGRRYARVVEKSAHLSLRFLPMPREHRLLSAPPLAGRHLLLPRIHLLCVWRPRPPKRPKPASKEDQNIYEQVLQFGVKRVASLIKFGLFTAASMTLRVAWQQRNVRHISHTSFYFHAVVLSHIPIQWADFSYHMSAIIKGSAYAFYALLRFRPHNEGLYGSSLRFSLRLSPADQLHLRLLLLDCDPIVPDPDGQIEHLSEDPSPVLTRLKTFSRYIYQVTVSLRKTKGKFDTGKGREVRDSYKEVARAKHAAVVEPLSDL